MSVARADAATYLDGVLSSAVWAGNFIPAHDQTFDLAEQIAGKLSEFHAYVTSVRDAGQADDALTELAEAITSGVYDITRPQRVPAPRRST